MNINNFKDFKKLLDICRTQGVKSIEIAGIKLELNDFAPLQKLTAKNSRFLESTMEESLGNIDSSIPVPSPDIPTDTPTAEEILFWSTTGGPQESMTE